MKCSKHIDREPVGICVKCGRLVCEECAITIDYRIYCKECISNRYSSRENINRDTNINTENIKETVKKYTNKAVDVTNETVSRVKDYSESEEFKSNIDNMKNNYKTINMILGVIAILFLIPSALDVIIYIPKFINNSIYFLFNFQLVYLLVNIFKLLLNAVLIIVLLILAILLIKKFISIDKSVRIMAPAITVVAVSVLFTLTEVFVYGFHRYIFSYMISNITSFIIPVVLVTIGAYLDREEF